VVHAWDQWHDEDETWYARFKAFLAQPPDLVHGRSLIKAYRDHRGGSRLSPTGKRVKPPGRWSRQAAKFQWRERAEAWDRHELDRSTQEMFAELERKHHELERDRQLRELYDRRPDFHAYSFEQFQQNCAEIEQVCRDYAARGLTLTPEEAAREVNARRNATANRR
jgi:hypothetical protein